MSAVLYFICLCLAIVSCLTLILTLVVFRNCNPNEQTSIKPSSVSVLAEERFSTGGADFRSPHGSLLFMTASYSLDQFHFLQKSIDCLRDICNAGWDITLLLQVSNGLLRNDSLFRALQDQSYCVRTNRVIPIVLQSFGQIGFGLNSRHRAFVEKHLDEFDYFAYAEEDMLFTLSHLRAYLQEEERLRRVLPTPATPCANDGGHCRTNKNHADSWLHYQIGFLRFEDSVTESTLRVTWEYLPDQIHVAEVPGLGQYIVTNNLNQAMYIFSREQMSFLEKRCEFLSKPGRNAYYIELRKALNRQWKYLAVGVSEWSSSFQQVLQCGLRRVIPVQNFLVFMVHHSVNKAQKRRLRKDLLTMQNWSDLVANKMQKQERRPRPLHSDKKESESLTAPMTGGGGTLGEQMGMQTVAELYAGEISRQYNLHLMDLEAIKGKIRWAWP